MNPLEFLPRLVPGTGFDPDETLFLGQFSSLVSHIHTLLRVSGIYRSTGPIGSTGSTGSGLDSAIGNNSSTMSLNSTTSLLETDGPPQFLLIRLGKGLGRILLSQVSDMEFAESQILTVVNYLASRFALLCMGMAIVLNRTVIFAGTRHPSPFRWPSRLFLRGAALLALCHNTIPILQAAHLMGFRFPSLFSPFIDLNIDTMPGVGVLWGFYQAISLSNLVETFSSVAQGTIPYSETGMTLFEYSAAFQEVEMFGKLTPEIVIISLISVSGQIALHVQELFNTDRYRLRVSCAFGVLMLGYFGFAVVEGRLVYFPSICIIGYLPQLVIASIVLLCVGIQLLTILFTGAGLSNLEATFSGVSIEPNEDFYSALLKCGIVALTSAVNKRYTAEDLTLSMPADNWVELSRKSKLQEDQPTPYANELRLPPDAEEEKLDSQKTGPTSLMIVNRFIHVWQFTLHFCLYLYLVVRDTLMSLITFCGLAGWLSRQSTSAAIGVDTNQLNADQATRQVAFLRADFSSNAYSDDEEYLPSDDDDDKDDEDLYDEYDEQLRGESEIHNKKYADPRSTAVFESDDEVYQLTDEVLDLIRDGGIAYDILHSVIIPDDHPSRILAQDIAQKDATKHHQHSETTARSSSRRLSVTRARRSSGVDSEEYREVMQLVGIIMSRREKAAHDLERQRQMGVPINEAVSVDRFVCVVCKSNPREIVVWPCRCFAICNDCRVSLAARQFTGCVCCRKPVASYSGIYLP